MHGKLRKMLHFYRMMFGFFQENITDYLLRIGLGLALLSFYSCDKAVPKNVEIAFYHWQTSLQISSHEAAFLKQTNTKSLYIKFFDVDKVGDKLVPKASLQVKDSMPNYSVIPTVFITNRTFKRITEAKNEELVDKILAKIFRLFEEFPKQELQEIQVDCDWTESTQVAYFYFLNKMQSRLVSKGIRLSVTIRLHQIKYAKRTGVPPADRGMLMYYNTGEIKNQDTQNSILDNDTAIQYIAELSDYPLELDLALPLFRWGILYREGKLVRLLNNLDRTDLSDSDVYEGAGNTFSVRKNTYLAGHYIYKGDKIRLEKVELLDLQTAVDDLMPIWTTDDFRLTFYHIDSLTIEHFSSQGILNLQEMWQK